MRFASWLAVLSCLVDAATPAEGKAGGAPKVRCVSGIKGDFGYRTCAAFCSEAKKANHCNFCKCKDCVFCGGTVVAGASS